MRLAGRSGRSPWFERCRWCAPVVPHRASLDGPGVGAVVVDALRQARVCSIWVVCVGGEEHEGAGAPVLAATAQASERNTFSNLSVSIVSLPPESARHCLSPEAVRAKPVRSRARSGRWFETVNEAPHNGR